jgi:hypothetical protein
MLRSSFLPNQMAARQVEMCEHQYYLQWILRIWYPYTFPVKDLFQNASSPKTKVYQLANEQLTACMQLTDGISISGWQMLQDVDERLLLVRSTFSWAHFCRERVFSLCLITTWDSLQSWADCNKVVSSLFVLDLLVTTDLGCQTYIQVHREQRLRRRTREWSFFSRKMILP